MITLDEAYRYALPNMPWHLRTTHDGGVRVFGDRQVEPFLIAHGQAAGELVRSLVRALEASR